MSKFKELLSIAGFYIELRSDQPFRTDVGYQYFISDKALEPTISINCRSGIPSSLTEGYTNVFISESEDEKYYSIYSDGKTLLFLLYDQENGDIQQVAETDMSFTDWTIYSEPKSGFLEPLCFPMGPVLFHYLTLTTKAVMMHASCVFDGEKGRLFSGFSGAGKSTISGIWEDAGSLMVNDDRVIIRKEDDDFVVYNTPMYYADVPKSTHLDAIYLISHASTNVIKKISDAEAVSGVMAFSVQNNFDKRYVLHHLDFFSELCTEVSVYKLGFVPNVEVIDFIKKEG